MLKPFWWLVDVATFRGALALSRKCAAMTLLIALPGQAEGLTIGPAPDGEPVAVAQRIIQTNFGRAVCPRVAAARRLPDRTIHATCSNRETFRVFFVRELRENAALRCSAARQMGVSC